MKHILTALFILISIKVSSQCSSINSLDINSIYTSDVCSDGTATYTINLDVDISSSGNASACLFWYFQDTLRNYCWTDGTNLIDYDTTINADCASLFALGGYSSSNGSGTNCTLVFIGNPLPVEFVSMIVHGYYGYNEIKWLTASEINNKGFEVQRSEDGINWDVLAWVDGNGFSNELITWKYYDFDFKANNYYRIRQIDYDGSDYYSKITYIKRPIKYTEIYDLMGRKIKYIQNIGLYLFVDPVTGKKEMKNITLTK